MSNTILKDVKTYEIQRMNTLIFDELSMMGCEDFLATVKWKNSEWIKDPVTFNTAQIMVDLMNLYKNYKSTVLWDAQRKYANSTIITLATTPKKYRANNSARKKTQGTTSGKANGLAKWRFDHTVNDKSDPEGNKFVWCKKHICKDENGVQSVIYMPEPHNHKEWKERKTAWNTAWKENQKAQSNQCRS